MYSVATFSHLKIILFFFMSSLIRDRKSDNKMLEQQEIVEEF